MGSFRTHYQVDLRTVEFVSRQGKPEKSVM